MQIPAHANDALSDTLRFIGYKFESCCFCDFVRENKLAAEIVYLIRFSSARCTPRSLILSNCFGLLILLYIVFIAFISRVNFHVTLRLNL